MINIIFPPGCYGTYLTKCIYNYTNLRSGPLDQFDFDEHGSSHSHRGNIESKKHIRWQHIDTFVPVLNDTIVTVLPMDHHNLDYYNNQFYKQEKEQLVSYIKTHFTNDEIFDKLKNNWGVSAPLDKNVPLWILREWCSFWIEECWSNGYNRSRYSALSTLSIEATDIVDLFETTFVDLIYKLGLILTVDLSIIKQTHKNFQQKQRFHNAQSRCIEWVDCVISNQPKLLIQPTIFDEAYIQKILRVKGYEIYCDGLNVLPTQSTKMKELIYCV